LFEKQINNDLKNLKKWENIDYLWIKVERTLKWEYKIWDIIYNKIENAVNEIKKNISKKYYKLIMKWWDKEFEKIRNNLKWKEFWEWKNIFKIDQNWKLLKKVENGWFKEIDIDTLSKKEQEIITNQLLWEKWYTTINKTLDNLSNSKKTLWEIFNWTFWEKLKKEHPKSIKSIEWLYNQSIWSYMEEVIKSWKGLKNGNIAVFRTLFTWKHSDEVFGKFMIWAWLPSKWNLIWMWLLGTWEALTWNFNNKDFIWNYVEIVMLWWLWTTILETPTLISALKETSWIVEKGTSSIERN
jgi:hypothetical protein